MTLTSRRSPVIDIRLLLPVTEPFALTAVRSEPAEAPVRLTLVCDACMLVLLLASVRLWLLLVPVVTLVLLESPFTVV